MIKGIAVITFKVSDLNRSCDYYEKTLGLSVAYKDAEAGWAEIDLNGVHLGLHQAEPAGGARNPYISLLVDDIDKSVAALKEKGVNFTSDVTSESYGKLITVSDPDGNQFELFEPAD